MKSTGRMAHWFLLAMLASVGALRADQVILPEVPNYHQNQFGPEGNDCGPTAAAMLLGYHDSTGWPNLIPNATAGMDSPGLQTLVRHLKREMPFRASNGTWDEGAIIPFVSGTIGDDVRAAAARMDARARSWRAEDFEDADDDRIKNEIRNRRPLLVMVGWNSMTVRWSDTGNYQSIDFHWMTIHGFNERGGDFYLVMRSGWRNGGNASLWYNWYWLDDFYIVEVGPVGASSGVASGSGRSSGGGASGGGGSRSGGIRRRQ